MSIGTPILKSIGFLYRVNPPLYYDVRRRYDHIASAKKWAPKDPNIVPKPGYLDIELSVICNLRCSFCWWWGEKGVAFGLVKNKDPRVSNQITTKEVFNIIDQAHAMDIRSVYLSGGEPFIRQDTTEIIEYAASKGLSVSLTTNGTLISDQSIQALAQIRNLSMTFSIDGTRDVHDKIRGPGMFDRTVSTISRLVHLRGAAKGPVLRTNTTFSPWLLGHTMELASALDALKVDEISFQHLWFTSREKADAHKRFLKSSFGVDDNGADSHVISAPAQMYVEQLADEVAQLESARFRNPIFIRPKMTREQIIKYYTDLNFSLRKNCIAPWDILRVKSGGEVVFCPDEWVNYKVGNIRSETMEHIWYNEKSRKFREVLSSAGLFPACARCCYIH